MAEPVLLSNAAVWLGGVDLSAQLNSLTLGASKAELTSGVLGDTMDVAHPGLASVDCDMAGFWYSNNASDPDAFIFARMSDATIWPVTYIPPYSPTATPNTAGNFGYTLTGAQFNYKLGAKHGELFPFSMKSKPRTTGALMRQFLTWAQGTNTGTGNGTGLLLSSAISATQKLVGVLHVFTVGTSVDVVIESDDNAGFTTATTRLTFTQATSAPSTQIVSVNGAIATDTYYRARVTANTGNYSIAVLFSVENQ